jgi:hypothetical protein
VVVAAAVLVVSDDEQRLREHGRRLDGVVDVGDELFARPDVARRVLVVLAMSVAGG